MIGPDKNYIGFLSDFYRFLSNFLSKVTKYTPMNLVTKYTLYESDLQFV